MKFRAGVSPAAARALRGEAGAKLQAVIPRIGTQVLSLPSAAAAERALAQLQANPAVAYAEPNGSVHALAIPNDYYANAILYYWTGELIDAQWPLWQMGMDAAWEVGVGDPDVIVAVIDTGADLTHPDLAGMSVGTINVIDPLPGTPSQDDFGHGTAMAGCAVPHTDNTEGVAGTSWGCRLLSVKCLDNAGEGEFDDCAVGIIAAADWTGPGVVRVVNMSWGDYFPSQTVQDAIDYAHGKGIVCVAAMGNDGDASVLWPAAGDNVIAVGGTNIMGGRSSLSNIGPHISIAAPSGAAWELWDVGVLSPIPTYSTELSDLFEYYLTPYSIFDLLGMGYMLPLAGTSFSTAHVSGVAALMLSHTPTLTPAEVKAILELTATDIGSPGWDQETGWGLVNAGAAMAYIDETRPICSITVTGEPECGTPLTFEANATDPGGDPIAQIAWDFGDGGTAAGDPALHCFGALGEFVVTCTVTDAAGDVGTCSTAVTVTFKTVSFFLSGPAWHLISLPCEPIDPDPAMVFDELAPYGDPSLLSGNLHRFDPVNKQYQTWYDFAPGAFGGPLQLCEGYWLYVHEDTTIAYEGCCPCAEHACDFPVAGWHIMGHPQLGPVDVRSAGMQAELGASGRVPYCSAAVPYWISDPLVGYSPTSSSYYYVTCGTLFPGHELLPFEGYWVDVKEAGVRIYVPLPP